MLCNLTCWQEPVIGCRELLLLLQVEGARSIVIEREDVNAQGAHLQIERLGMEKSTLLQHSEK